MTTIDYILLGAFAAAALYTGYRLFVGSLRTPSHEIDNGISNIPKATAEPSSHERGLASQATAQLSNMRDQFR